MKRALVIAVCLSILYAGAASAFAGCEGLTRAAAGHDHGDNQGEHHHGDAPAPAHSESGNIHCATLFGAFVIGSRISPKSEPRVAAAVIYPSFDSAFFLQVSGGHRFDLGPPGAIIALSRPLHLLLSVIRI